MNFQKFWCWRLFYSTARSPVFSHLSASLQGLHTIRASGIQEKFTSEFDVHQNLHTETWFLFLATSRWFAVRLDWLCVIFVTTVSFCCVFASESKFPWSPVHLSLKLFYSSNFFIRYSSILHYIQWEWKRWEWKPCLLTQIPIMDPYSLKFVVPNEKGN